VGKLYGGANPAFSRGLVSTIGRHESVDAKSNYSSLACTWEATSEMDSIPFGTTDGLKSKEQNTQRDRRDVGSFATHWVRFAKRRGASSIYRPRRAAGSDHGSRRL